MTTTLDRREFLRIGGAALATGGVSSLVAPAAEQLAHGAPHAEKLGWRLGCQAYTFNRFTFYEAIEKVRSLGLHWIEAYPGQRLSPENPDVRTNDSMSPAIRKEVKKRLADAGVTLVNYGVTRLSGREAADRKVFDFAKEMGIETIVSEPPLDAFQTLDKLANEYQINVAIHNHPKPSRYWNPDTVLQVCEGRSRRIGACADTGHWMRSGLNPLEQLKKLKGRIITFHFKDLNKFGRGAHDVPWGTGKANVRALLQEIHRQGLKAVFSIEYEHNWLNSLPEIAQCVRYFDQVAAELSRGA
ncbi:MAG TPA: sugar phosphate isomerase/epimerase [Planctomycetaceae bacterium]|nr:sugar phosphate isomerase/epimerase [Planctomycetaceae bacterium]